MASGHTKHADASALEYKPVGQDVHTAAGITLKVPTGQMKQFGSTRDILPVMRLVFVDGTLPDVHVLQWVPPTGSVYIPTGHTAQVEAFKASE